MGRMLGDVDQEINGQCRDSFDDIRHWNKSVRDIVFFEKRNRLLGGRDGVSVSGESSKFASKLLCDAGNENRLVFGPFKPARKDRLQESLVDIAAITSDFASGGHLNTQSRVGTFEALEGKLPTFYLIKLRLLLVPLRHLRN